jgi:hypothetical protein
MVAAIFEARMTRRQAEWLASLMAESRAARPTGVVSATLLYDNGLGKLIAVWRNRDTLDRYLSVTAIPRGVELMRQVGVEPSVRIVDVLECA